MKPRKFKSDEEQRDYDAAREAHIKQRNDEIKRRLAELEQKQKEQSA